MNNFVVSCIDNVDGNQPEICEIANDMQRGKYKVLNLVEELGSYFTASEVSKRIQACELFCAVLQKLPDDCLSSEEISHLSEFLAAKLQDHYTIQPAVLTGLVKISCSSNLDQAQTKIIVNALFKEVHVRSCLQNERYKVFQILGNLFDNKKSTIISLGRDFVYNYIQAIDGEQDPRNLLNIFQLSAGLVKGGIEMSNLEEEFFDVASCYFPIDFNPASAGKKATITNQDLVLGLRSFLTSSAIFSKYCIPLCLEKMESDVENAKIDAILTLTDGLSKYTKKDLEPFLSSLWARLKQEIAHVVSQDVEKTALALLTQLVKNLSQWPIDFSVDTISDLHSFLSQVINDCLPRLEEPIQDKLTWMSGLMILACAKGSKSAFKYICSAVLPLLLEKANKLQSEPSAPAVSTAVPLLPTGMNTVVEYLVKITAVCSSFTYPQDQHPFKDNCKSILSLFINIITKDYNVQTKCIAIAGIASLLKLDVLDKEDTMVLAGCFFGLSCDNVDKRLNSEVLSATGFLASKHPLLVKSALLPKLFQTVPIENCFTVPISSLKRSFSFFPTVCAHIELLKEVTTYLIQLINLCKIDDNHTEFLTECVLCLQKITQNCASDSACTEHLSSHVALPLIKKSIESSLIFSTPEQCCVSCNPAEKFSTDCNALSFIKSVAVVVRNICQKHKPGKTADLLVQTMVSLYLKQDISSLGIEPAANARFEPFNPNCSLFQTRTICFLTSSICAMDKAIDILSSNDFMNSLLDLALNSPDQPTYVAAAKSFSGLLNKSPETNDNLIEKVQLLTRKCLDDSSFDKKMNALTLLIWTTKALVLRNHKQTKTILNMLLNFLSDPDVGEIAAAGFDIILRDSDEVLNSASHSVIRMMFRQRFFLIVLPELISGFNASKTDQTMKEDSCDDHSLKLSALQQKKANHLTALSHMLLHLPKQVVLQEFPSLLPLLIHSLRSRDSHLLHSVLSALYYLLQDAFELMESHIDTLLDDFLRLSLFKTNLNVRLKAVQCVGVSTLLSTPVILPLKGKVVRQLALVLDDPKRDVRTEAAKARSEWFLVGV